MCVSSRPVRLNGTRGGIEMTRYNYRGFYGDYGHMIVHNDGTTNLEMICGGKVYRKKYKSLRSAKAALTRMSDAYTLTEYKED